MSDKIGAFNTTTTVYATAAIFVLCIWLPAGQYVSALYVFAVFFGGCVGSLIGLGPVCIGQLCHIDEFGRRLGMCYCLASALWVHCSDSSLRVIDRR